MDSAFVLDLREIDRSRFAEVGGKAANLGELSRIAGVDVPPGSCVTTHAFRRAVRGAPALVALLEELTARGPDDRDGIAASSAELREAVGRVPLPDDVAAAVTRSLAPGTAYAVRSSATAEDLPTASFAGLQDSYLGVVGPAAVLEHVRLCWASLFTERAVAYRLRHGVDHRSVAMAVVIQELVAPDASGVLFTADPVTSNRRISRVEAVLGLGEALVSGTADADRWSVRDGEVVDATIVAKPTAQRAAAGGGTSTQPVEPEAQRRPTLTDTQVVRLAEVGRRIEAHLGHPQDIEWCLVDDGFRIVQSRPITTLFPLPPVDDGAGRVYLSVGHQQMMTDAMTPLGLSVWQMTTPRPMAEAGGRLFVDVTGILASTTARDGFLEAMGRHDPLVRDALATVVDRGDVVPAPSDGGAAPPAGDTAAPTGTPALLDADPALVEELIAHSEASVAAAARDIRGRRGTDLFDAVLADFQELRRLLFDPRSHQVFTTAMDAAFWLDEHMQAWLGEEHAADTLTLSVPNNITSEMGLALLDVADVIRPHPEAVAFLRGVEDDTFLDDLPRVAGGRAAAEAIHSYLARYGMRCAGEIDIGRPRWSERPSTLVPAILADVDHAEPGAARRRVEAGRRAAREREQELLERVRALPDGASRAVETRAMIDRLRTFIGFREYPKYAMVCRYFVYKQALMAEAGRLVQEGVLGDREDAFFLRFDELHDAVRTGTVDDARIRGRREALAWYRTLTPPRVLTSDGEALVGAHRRDGLPDGALVGLAVSGGTVEGRARVVREMADADLEPGDILVTTFTDPSWSPVFVTIGALVTEVGGVMTHGAVVAREYGLPAVVGVEGATRRVPDGAWIRVNGTDGYVELLA